MQKFGGIMLERLINIFKRDTRPVAIEDFQIGQKIWCKIKDGKGVGYIEPVVIEYFDKEKILFTVKTKRDQKYKFTPEELRDMEKEAANDGQGSAEDIWNVVP